MSTTAFRLDNLVKRMVFCYLQTIVGEFPFECKNDNNNNNNNDNNNNNNNDNNDGKKKLPCLRSCRQTKFFLSAELCNI